MSVSPPAHPHLPRWTSRASAECNVPPATTTQEQIVQATRAEISQLAGEIAALARRDLTLDQYFAEFLSRIVQALASVAGAVWIQEGDQPLTRKAHINWAHVVTPAAQSAHLQSLRATIADQRLSSRPPCTGAADDDSQNPTDYLWLAMPVQVDRQMTAVIEVFQRPHRGPVTERGYARFLADMAQWAGKFLGDHRLGQLLQHQQWSEQLCNSRWRFIVTWMFTIRLLPW